MPEKCFENTWPAQIFKAAVGGFDLRKNTLKKIFVLYATHKSALKPHGLPKAKPY